MTALFILAALILLGSVVVLYVACRRVERVVEAVKLRERAEPRSWS